MQKYYDYFFLVCIFGCFVIMFEIVLPGWFDGIGMTMCVLGIVFNLVLGTYDKLTPRPKGPYATTKEKVMEGFDKATFDRITKEFNQ